MKNLLLMSIGMFSVSGASAQAPTAKGGKALVVYYSRTGQNYRNGDIVDLKKGNTAVIAEKIAALTGADTFEIKTVKDYPADYYATTDVAKKELNSQARPEIVGGVENIDDYDVIFLGYPNWWGTAPMAVFTFIEAHANLKGKTVMPFCTHEGSAMGHSESDLKKACPDASVMKGLPVRGGSVTSADKQVADWVKTAPLK